MYIYIYTYVSVLHINQLTCMPLGHISHRNEQSSLQTPSQNIQILDGGFSSFLRA